MQLYSQTAIDTVAPSIAFSKDCNIYTIRITEKTFGDTLNGTYQFDSGISTMPNLVTNNIDTINVEGFKPGKVNREFELILRVIDPFNDASVEIFVYDNNDQVALRKINYFADKLFINPIGIDFGESIINKTKDTLIRIENPRSFNMQINDIHFQDGRFFKTEEFSFPFNLRARSDTVIRVFYTPEIEISEMKPYDRDRLYIETDCLQYEVSLIGTPVNPEIMVEDIYFDHLLVDKRTCYNSSFNFDFDNGVKIKNIGTGTLIIDNIRLDSPDGSFILNDTLPNIPQISIEPNDSVFVREICFRPNSVGEKSGRLIFSSNAQGSDSIANLRGIGVENEVFIEHEDFLRVRKYDSLERNIRIVNRSEEPIFVKSIRVLDEANFSVFPERANPIIDSELVPIFPDTITDPYRTKSITIPVQFHPQDEFKFETRVVVLCEDLEGNEFEIGNYLVGFGFLPKVKVTGYKLDKKILVNSLHPDTAKVTIKSVSESSGLWLKNIDYSSFFTDNRLDFEPLQDEAEDVFIPQGDSLIFKFLFRPSNDGIRLITPIVQTDAYDGKFIGSSKDTTVVVEGEAFNKILSGESHMFPTIFQCDTAMGKIYLRNVSSTDTAYVRDFIFTQEDTLAFNILNRPTPQQPVIIEPGDSSAFEFSFIPSNLNKTNYVAYGYFISEIDSSIVRMFGSSYKIDLNFSFNDLIKTNPGVSTNSNQPGSIDFGIDLDSDSLSKANITEINLSVPFNRHIWYYEGYTLPGEALPNDWTIQSSVTPVFGDSLMLNIRASGPTPISETGTILKPVLILLLSNTLEYEATIAEIELPLRDHCFNYSIENGNITLFTCGMGDRPVNINPNEFEIQNISPNPVNKEGIAIEYSVGLQSEVEVSVYNINGQLIETIANGRLQVGDYLYYLDGSKLTAGVYSVVIRSNHYSNSKQFIVR